jgi:hypothetical protein
VSPIPELNWDQVRYVDFEATGVSCPLPAGLIAYFNAGKTMKEWFAQSVFPALNSVSNIPLCFPAFFI